jgi:polyferredoxin
VTYDKGRGEPRGKQVGSGDCIDCGLCTRVCPTGIDIRNGLQLECIQCMRCVDACDSIMANLKRPIGLIKVISQSDLRGQERVAFYRRPRVLLYMGLLTIIIVGGALRAYTRDPIAVTFLRQTGSPYGKLDDGRISNLFNMRAINHEGTEGLIKIEVADSSPGVEVLCPGCAEPIAPFGEKVSPVIIILGKEFTGQNVRLRVVGGTAVQELPIIRP